MARKSRKEAQRRALMPAAQTAPQTDYEKAPILWRAGIYARLSVPNMLDLHEEPIEVQVQIMQEYISGQADIELVDTYCDNGYSGATFNRPAFRRMLGDIEGNRINCVIVRDFSRFGRNYLEAGEFIDNTFPHRGIRFISVFDHYDSLQGDQNYMSRSMKHIINDLYLRDLSRKSASVIRQIQGQGYFWGLPPYGYTRREDVAGLICMDTNVAPGVYLMFYWAYTGIDRHQVATYLDDLELGPSAKAHTSRTSESSKYYDKWDPYYISDLLQLRIYTGDLIVGEHRQSRSSVSHADKKDDIIVCSDNHAPYINRDVFESVCAMQVSRVKAFHNKNAASHYSGRKKQNPYSYLLYCGVCGHRMRYNGKEKRSVTGFKCHGHYAGDRITHKEYSISIQELNDAAMKCFRDVQQEAKKLNNLLAIIGETELFTTLEGSTEMEIQQLNAAYTVLAEQAGRLEGDLDSGILDADVKRMQEQKISVRQREVQKELRILEGKLLQIRSCKDEIRIALDEIIAQDLSGEASTATIHLLATRIDIFQDKSIYITMRHGPLLDQLQTCLREYENRKGN